jgi:hypothetical protein
MPYIFQHQLFPSNARPRYISAASVHIIYSRGQHLHFGCKSKSDRWSLLNYLKNVLSHISASTPCQSCDTKTNVSGNSTIIYSRGQHLHFGCKSKSDRWSLLNYVKNVISHVSASSPCQSCDNKTHFSGNSTHCRLQQYHVLRSRRKGEAVVCFSVLRSFSLQSVFDNISEAILLTQRVASASHLTTQKLWIP